MGPSLGPYQGKHGTHHRAGFESFCWLDSCTVILDHSVHATEEVRKIDSLKRGHCVLPMLREPQIEYPHLVFMGWVFISLGWYFWSQFRVPHYSNHVLYKHKSAAVNTFKEFLGICHLDFSQIIPAVMNRLWSASETVVTLNSNNTVWHLNWN